MWCTTSSYKEAYIDQKIIVFMSLEFYMLICTFFCNKKNNTLLQTLPEKMVFLHVMSDPALLCVCVCVWGGGGVG